MPASTREDKKREILQYLHAIDDLEGDFANLEKDAISERFSDEYYGEEDIGEIIDELVDNEPVESGEFKLELIYLDEFQDSIENTLKPLSSTPLWQIFFWGFYLLLILVVGSDVFNKALEGASDSQIFSAAVLGTVIAYFGGRLLNRFSDYVNAQLPIVREHRNFIYPTAFLILTGFFIAWYLSLNRTVQTYAYVSIIPTSVLAGATVARYLNTRSDSDRGQSAEFILIVIVAVILAAAFVYLVLFPFVCWLVGPLSEGAPFC